MVDPAAPVVWQEIDGVAFTGVSLLGSRYSRGCPHARLWNCFKHGLPVFGSCYGGAIGGGGSWRAALCQSERARDSYCRDIRLSDAGKTHAIYDGKPECLMLYVCTDDVLAWWSAFQFSLLMPIAGFRRLPARRQIFCFGTISSRAVFFAKLNYLERSDVKGFRK